jgi:Spy/CpxP family protein refolding chaperone
MQPRTQRIVRWTAIAAAATAVAGWGLAQAREGGFGHHGGGPGFGPGFGLGGFGPLRGLMADLDLTDDQQAQLRAIAKRGFAASADERAQLDALRKELEATVTANGFNEAEVRAIAARGTPVLTELMVDMVRGASEMRAVLTPEQQRLFDERRAEFEARRAERRAKRAAAPAGTT